MTSLDPSTARVGELIAAAIQVSTAQDVLEVSDPALLAQALELARTLELPLLPLLRRWRWHRVPEALLCAAQQDEAAARRVALHLACDAVAGALSELLTEPEARRSAQEHLDLARQIADGQAAPLDPSAYARRFLELPAIRESHRRSIAQAAAQLCSPDNPAGRALHTLEGAVDLAPLEWALEHRLSALLSGRPLSPTVVRLSGALWRATQIDERGEVEEVTDPLLLQQVVEVGRLTDPEALLEALALLRWPAAAYPLLLAAVDGDEVRAARESRHFACDCLAHAAPEHPLLATGRAAADSGQRPLPPDGAVDRLSRWLLDRSPTRAARNTARTAASAAPSWPEARRWQQDRLLARVRVLLESTPSG